MYVSSGKENKYNTITNTSVICSIILKISCLTIRMMLKYKLSVRVKGKKLR